MQKYLIVVYDFYDLLAHGDVKRIQKWEKVYFCKENLEYNDKLSYEDNVSSFVLDCIENQAVYLGDKYIPLHNIHGFYLAKDTLVQPQQQPQQVQQQNKQNHQNTNPNRCSNHNQRFEPGKKHGYKKIKHRTRMPSSSDLPFNVEKASMSTTEVTNTTSTNIIVSDMNAPEATIIDNSQQG